MVPEPRAGVDQSTLMCSELYIKAEGVIEDETYRGEGKGRRCSLGDVLECRTSHLQKQQG